MGNMRIVKLSEEACRALEQLGVPFEQIGVVAEGVSKAERGPSPAGSSIRPRDQSPGRDESSLRPNPKALGAENRRRYLQKLRQHGVMLEHERRTAYLTRRGNRVVLPMANAAWNPGKWFLGAPKEFFERPSTALVLICKEDE